MIATMLLISAVWAGPSWAAKAREPNYGRTPENISYSHWLSSGQAGYAIRDDTPLRNAAYSQGDVLARLPAGAALDIVQRAPFWERIGDLREPWYTVKLPGKPGEYAEVWGGNLARAVAEVRLGEKPAFLLVGIASTSRDSRDYPSMPVPFAQALLISEGRVLGKASVPVVGYIDEGRYPAKWSVEAVDPAKGLGRATQLFIVKSTFDLRGYEERASLLVWDGANLFDGLDEAGSGGECTEEFSFIFPGDKYGRPGRVGVERMAGCEGDDSPPQPVYTYWRWEPGRFVEEPGRYILQDGRWTTREK